MASNDGSNPVDSSPLFPGGIPVFLDAASVRSLLPNPSLLRHLESALPSAAASVRAPLRQGFLLDPAASASLLLMPAWSPAASALPYVGVKLVTSFPGNSARALPGVHAAYVLFDSATGAVLASMDGTQLTLLRTAAISALATKFLAREEARVLVMVGAGALAPYLVRAHLLIRPAIRRVIVWNRTPGRARELVESLRGEPQLQGVELGWSGDLDEVVGMGDVVSCATSSTDPVVKGSLLKPGAHLDLVGSFTPSMRECDEEALRRGRVFVDCEAALEEAGELVGAFQRGSLSAGDVAGSLVDLVGGGEERAAGRRSDEEVTVFKSVGSAVVDLLAAQLAYETYLQGAH